jgi:uncharacterized protein (TIGR02145 family)
MYTGEFTADVVWEDADVINGTPTVSGFGNAAKVTVTTNNSQGNAVVAIRKGSDIVWSYHIWVTNYDGTTTWTNPNQTAHTFTFMDRNLGATEAANSLAGRGLFYQWGRKDPFPGGKSGTAGYAALSKVSGLGSAGTVSSDNNAGAIVESIQKPTTFYRDKTNGNWLPESPERDNFLWSTDGTASGQKRIYDPCPSGWRVPARTSITSTSDDYSPWKGVADPTSWSSSSDTGGVTNWGTNAKYPAAGYRIGSSGSISTEGSGGVYWSASPFSSSSNYASGLYFHSSGYINRSYSNNRAYGFSVRCAQE